MIKKKKGSDLGNLNLSFLMWLFLCYHSFLVFPSEIVSVDNAIIK